VEASPPWRVANGGLELAPESDQTNSYKSSEAVSPGSSSPLSRG